MYSSYFLERLKIKIIHRKVYIYNYLFPDIRFQHWNLQQIRTVSGGCLSSFPDIGSDHVVGSCWSLDQSDSTIIFQTTPNVFYRYLGMEMGRFNVALLRFLFVIILVNRLWEQAVNIAISSMEIKWSQKQFIIWKRKDEEELEAPDCTLGATWYATGLDGIFIWCNNSVKAPAPNILPVYFSFKYKLFNQVGNFLSRLAAIRSLVSSQSFNNT